MADVTTIDHRTFRKRHLNGQLPPGTYRVYNSAFPRKARVDVRTIPSRIPSWVRSPNGKLWHRIRLASIGWNFAGRRRPCPALHIETWCGMGVGRTLRATRDPTLSDSPREPLCRHCMPPCSCEEAVDA